MRHQSPVAEADDGAGEKEETADWVWSGKWGMMGDGLNSVVRELEERIMGHVSLFLEEI